MAQIENDVIVPFEMAQIGSGVIVLDRINVINLQTRYEYDSR